MIAVRPVAAASSVLYYTDPLPVAGTIPARDRLLSHRTGSFTIPVTLRVALAIRPAASVASAGQVLTATVMSRSVRADMDPLLRWEGLTRETVNRDATTRVVAEAENEEVAAAIIRDVIPVLVAIVITVEWAAAAVELAGVELVGHIEDPPNQEDAHVAAVVHPQGVLPRTSAVVDVGVAGDTPGERFLPEEQAVAVVDAMNITPRRLVPGSTIEMAAAAAAGVEQALDMPMVEDVAEGIMAVTTTSNQAIVAVAGSAASTGDMRPGEEAGRGEGAGVGDAHLIRMAGVVDLPVWVVIRPEAGDVAGAEAETTAEAAMIRVTTRFVLALQFEGTAACG